MSLAPSVAGSLATRLAYIASLLFTLASAGTNLIYGWHRGADLPGSIVWAAVSGGVSIVFALSWPALIRSVDSKHWTRALIVLAGLLLTGTYSVSAALGSAMGSRANAASEERAVVDAREKARAAYDSASAELAGLTFTRPAEEQQALIQSAKGELTALGQTRRAGELEALLEGVKTDPRSGGCVGFRGSLRMRCPKVTEWRAELARAKRREELIANIATWTEERGRSEQRQKLRSEIDKATAQLGRLPPARVANSDAVALATYLQGLGFTGADPDRLNKLLVLLAVLVIECGGGLSLAIGMSLSATDPHERNASHTAIVERSAPVQGQDIGTGHRDRPKPRTVVSPGTSETRLLAMLRDRGGQIIAGQRTFAEALGVSKTQVHRLLTELAAAQRISIEVGRRGTAVRLIGEAAL